MSGHQVYEIFARIKRGDNLMHIGAVEAENDDLAMAYAAMVYDEEDWVEMYTVRRDNLLCVHSIEPLFTERGVGA